MENQHTASMNLADFESFKVKFIAQGTGYEVVLDKVTNTVTIIWNE